MGIYVKTSSGVECLDRSFKLAKGASYAGSANYTLSASVTSGTTWDRRRWDDIGLSYVEDASIDRRNYFIVPSSGILIIQCYIAFVSNGPASPIVIAGSLYHNQKRQNMFYSRAMQNFHTNFIWFERVNKDDTLAINLMHSEGDTIVYSGRISYLNFLLFS